MVGSLEVIKQTGLFLRCFEERLDGNGKRWYNGIQLLRETGGVSEISDNEA